MSRSLLILFLVLLLPLQLCTRALADDVPKATPAGQKALKDLVEACVKEGGLKEVPAPKDQGPWYEVANEKTLQEVVAARKDKVTDELRDALVSAIDAADAPQGPVYVALLQSVSDEKDERALAFAAFYSAWKKQERLQIEAAATAYEEAAKHFATLKYDGWHALSLHQLGVALQYRGGYVKALDCYEKALAIRQKLYPESRYPEGHRALAETLNNLGTLWQDRGDYVKAQGYLEQTLAMRQKLYPVSRYPQGHAYLANSLNNLGTLFRVRGEYVKAKEYFEQALTMRQKLYPEPRYPQGHPDVADSLSNLGRILQAQGEYAKAEGYLKQALAVRRNVYPDSAYPQGHPALAGNLNNLALLFHDMGEYTKALAYFEQALEMDRKLYPESHYPQGHPYLAIALNNIGLVLEDQGEYAKALAYYEQALTMFQKLYPEWRYPQGHPDLALILNNLGSVREDQGEYAKALDYYELALAMRQKLYPESRYPHGHPGLALILNNLGSVLEDQGEYAKALNYYELALAMRQKLYPESRYPQGHPDLAQSLHNLGSVLQYQGEYAKALDYYELALAMRQKLYPVSRYPQGHPDLARSLNNLGHLLGAQGEYRTALAHYRQAMLASRAVPKEVVFEQPERAAALLKPTPETFLFASNYAYLLYDQLTSEASVAELRACDQAYRLAVALHERLRSEVLQRDDSKLQHGAKVADVLGRRLNLYRRLFEREHDRRDLHAALAAFEQARARVFLDGLGEANAGRLAGLADKERAEEDRLRRALRICDAKLDIASKQGTEEARAELPKLWREQQDAEDALRQFARKLADSNPQYAALRFPKPCTVDEARACLDKNEVALLFAIGEDASYVLLLQARPDKDDQADGIAVYPLPGKAALAGRIDSLVQREQLELTDGVRSRGADLYRKLLGPIAKQIEGKDLVIVADGPLCHLPFELLVEGADGEHEGHWLLETHGIRYAPSLTALHMVNLWDAQRTKQPDQPLWAVGDPVYSAQDERLRTADKTPVAQRSQELLTDYLERMRGGEGFARLLSSGQEVTAIRTILKAKEDTVLTGLLASEAAVKAASKDGILARARYIHFATHGILGFDTGRQPALVLSLVGNDGKQDENGTNDGFLELTEVTGLKLNADLVVLSACRSGEGRLHNGEGISGLARAFQYAGCRGVVCSLWNVDDTATAELMKVLYQRLKDGQPAAQALREAKLAMIKDRRAPVYWAPFILMGR